MDERLASKQNAVFAGVLSNAMRLGILDRLAKGPCLVGDLAEAVGCPSAVVSKQLGILRAAGLLECRAEGRFREYALADPISTGLLLDSITESAQRAADNARRCRELHGHPGVGQDSAGPGK